MFEEARTRFARAAHVRADVRHPRESVWAEEYVALLKDEAHELERTAKAMSDFVGPSIACEYVDPG